MTANTDIVDIDGITKELITDCPQPVIELIETLYGELQIVKSELADYRAHNERDKADIRQDVTAVEDQWGTRSGEDQTACHPPRRIRIGI